MKAEKRKPGPPSSYTEAMGAAICARLSEGEPLRVICRSEGMPARRTVTDWVAQFPEFAMAYAVARAEGFDAIAADCLKIADEPQEGVEQTVKPDGAIEERRGDMLGHRKLRIETRLKLLAKWDPKRYGEKIELSGELGVRRTAADMTDDELAAVVAGKASGAAT